MRPFRCIRAGSADLNRLRTVPYDACMTARHPHTSSFAADLFRQSCEFDSKQIDEFLNPEFAEPELPCIPLVGEHVTLRNGGLRVPCGYVLCIDGPAVALEDVCVSGSGSPRPDRKSVPLLYAASGHLHLHSVTVSGNACGHGLGVGAGASVDAVDCSLSRNHTCGAVVRGCGARLTAKACRFERNGQDGASAVDGAAAVFERCMFSNNVMLGLAAAGEGTVVTALKCKSDGNNNHGAVASAGAHLSLESCAIAGNDVGVLALGADTHARVSSSSLKCNHQGLHVREGASAGLVDCSLHENNVGCCSHHPDTRLALDRCSILLAASAGVQVLAGSTTVMTGGSVTRCGGHGIVVQHVHSSLDAENVAVENNGLAGVQASIMAHARLVRCELSSNHVSGFQATVRTRLHPIPPHHFTLVGVVVYVTLHWLGLKACFLLAVRRMAAYHCNATLFLAGRALEPAQGNLASFFVRLHPAVHPAFLLLCVTSVSEQLGRPTFCHSFMQDQLTCVEIEHSNIGHNHTIGGFVNKGASAALYHCSLNQNGSSGCEVRDRISKLTALSCSFSNNGRVGLYAHSAAVAELKSCVVRKNEAYGLLCGGRSGADIGGGAVTLCEGTDVEGGKMVRQGGRIFAEIVAASEGEVTPVDTAEGGSHADSV
jgi:hypothetical protein